MVRTRVAVCIGSEQFEAQLIPEWRGAFVNYWQLKKDLNKFKPLSKPLPATSQSRKFSRRSIFGSGGQLTPITTFVRMKTSRWVPREREPDIIQVHRVSDSVAGDIYETEILQPFAEADADKVFFAELDAQLNKVNQFYGIKEQEFLERGETLKMQMQILIDFEATVQENPQKKSVSRQSSLNSPQSGIMDSRSTPCTPRSGMGSKLQDLTGVCFNTLETNPTPAIVIQKPVLKVEK
eukprot:Gb_39831 [translate_table: standard]